MSDDILLASAIRYLIDGGEDEAASVLLSCSLCVYNSGDTSFCGDEIHYAVHIELTGPRAAFEILKQSENPITSAIQGAFEAILPNDRYIKHFTAHAELTNIDPYWREELLEIARGKGVHNQAVDDVKARSWMNLRFRSQSEVRIAQALDQKNVLFLPNCRGRLGEHGNRSNKEADLVVCHNGKWGILEVDGEPFHPPSRTVHDHERDRLFRRHGIRVVEHFDADRCYQNPDEVVTEFLKILESS